MGKIVDGTDHLCGDNFFKLADGKRVIFSHFITSEGGDEILATLKWMSKNSGPFILITHNTSRPAGNSDRPIESTCQSWMPPNTLRWYSPNVHVSNPRIRAIPLGACNRIWSNGNFESIRRHMNKPKKKGLFASFALETNPKERVAAAYQANQYCGDKTIACYQTFHGMNKPIPHEKFCELMAEHRFVLSPPGAGTDCNRTWEALYLGCIPICKRSLTMSFFSDLPIFFVDDWSEVTPENLDKAERDLESKWANTNRLWMGWWKNEILGIKHD